MGKIRLPESDLGRIVLGKRALEQLVPLKAQTPGNNSDQPNSSTREIAHVGMFEENINSLFIERFQQEMERFQDLVEAEANASANFRTNLALLRGMMDSLSQAVRDSWAGIRRLARRKSLSKAILIAYKMPLKRSAPATRSERGWLEKAEELLEGDTAAIAQGYPAMTNPDAAEVRAILDQARERVNVVDETSLAHKEVQARLREQRVLIHNMFRVLAGSLRSALLGTNPSYTRDVMRKFGYTFANDSIETETSESQSEQEQAQSAESARS
jgi:hypothetical protein